MTIPNILTIIRILLTPVFLLLLLNDHRVGALVVFFIAGLTDGLDGFIARAFKQKSVLGAFLDPVADKTLLVTSFVALSWLGLVPIWLTALVITRDLAIMTGASLLVIADVPFEVKPSIAGKLTTLFQLATVFATLSSPVFEIHRFAQWALFFFTGFMTAVSGWQYAERWMMLWEAHDGKTRFLGRISRRLFPLWYGESAAPRVLREVFAVPYLFAVKIGGIRAISKRVRTRSAVVSIGNLTTGGTGKTPLTIDLADFLSKCGYRVAVVTRSLGKNPVKIPEKVPSKASLEDVRRYGDEPVLIAARLPEVSVWTGESKSAVAQLVDSIEKPDIILVDDGFQHRRLERDMDIVLLNAQLCIGNGSTLPLGPLREPVSSLTRADVVVMVSDDNSGAETCLGRVRKWIREDAVILSCHRRIEEIAIGRNVISVESIKGVRCVAFAGIGYPEGFFKELERRGVVVASSIVFPDHYNYTDRDISAILDQANKLSARLILTTEKDFVRLPERVKDLVG
ncbi:MAG: tetraacyldisaccharide 4'-kinase [Thermodesulforhabdaceae bacterium]